MGALAAAGVLVFAATPAVAKGNPNAGDVWVDNVGQPAGPGHEMDPHLACQDINLWANGMADGSGSFTIDGWAPSGSAELDYSGTWSYDRGQGGDQVAAVIDVGQLLRTAVANGDAPVNKQGYHFKLQFVQDPQKHKTFWVSCTPVSLATTASSGTVGQDIQDTAILSGGFSPTGAITWKLYGPGDPGCSAAPLATYTDSTISGDGTYYSPTYTTTGAGTYQWVASYSGDAINNATAGSCGDPAEQSMVSQAVPQMTSDAVSGTLGSPIHDQVTLTGGYSPSGTLSWNVYASGDTSCSAPLNASTITAPVNGDGTYDSPDYTPTSAGTYQWVATYSGDANNVPLTGSCGDPTEQSTVTNAAAPAIRLHKLEKIGPAGFVHGPLSGPVGQRVAYQMMVTDTGNTPLVIDFTDGLCDTGTLSAANVVAGAYDAATRTLGSGGELRYTCSHVLAAADQPYTNTASVTGTAPSGQQVSDQDSVQAYANTPGIQVLKLERDASRGAAFTTGPITITENSDAYVVHTIQYEIQVTNTGNEPLTLTLHDPLCDAGTVRGPIALSGKLTGRVLSAGGEAKYLCSHALLQSDPSPFTNTATVVGKPRVGPPVSGTSTVTVVKKSVKPKRIRRCRTPGGRIIRYTGHKMPKACHAPKKHHHKHHHTHHHKQHRHHPPSRHPRGPRGFTG